MSSSESVFEVDEVPDSGDGLGGGNYVDKEGRFHVFITSVDTEKFMSSDDNELRHFNVEMEVMAGDYADQVNRKLNKRVFIERWTDKKAGIKELIDEKRQKSVAYFLRAFGVFQPGEKASVTQAAVESLIDKQAVVLVQKGNDWTKTNEDGTKTTMEGRHEMRWENDCWPVDHQDVVNVPKDHELLAAAGIVLGSGTSSKPSSAGSAATAAAPSAAADPLANL